VKERAIPVFKKYHIPKAVLFGFAVKNRCRPDSDIDLFVSPLRVEEYWDFMRELEDTIGLPGDMHTDTD
jgi:predicted nucleotidyltransferase|tara:strand:- start:4303 stop:4509 length:207 start_codon:yes stop_codon:yes gene_type:complete